MITKALFVLVLLPAIIVAADEPKEIPLWPNGAPGSEGKTDKEIVQRGASGERSVYSIHNPSVTPYLPPKDKTTGAAVIVIPGGGHRVLAIDHEGYNVAQWLSERGIAAFVLKYRLARETNSTYQVEVHALADTQRAIRLVRSRAQEWGIDPARVGVMGFSAGGELAAFASMRFDNGVEGATDAVIALDLGRLDAEASMRNGPTTRLAPLRKHSSSNDREGLVLRTPDSIRGKQDGGRGWD